MIQLSLETSNKLEEYLQIPSREIRIRKLRDRWAVFLWSNYKCVGCGVSDTLDRTVDRALSKLEGKSYED